MLFKFIARIKIVPTENNEDIEFIVVPKGNEDIIFSYTNVEIDESNMAKCDVKIIRREYENANDVINTVLTDNITYDKLSPDEPIKALCDYCFEELIIYLVEYHEIGVS